MTTIQFSSPEDTRAASRFPRTTPQHPNPRRGPCPSSLEAILADGNIAAAWERVHANNGSGGTDGVSVRAMTDRLRHEWPPARQQLMDGTYRPSPVKRVALAKPDGRVRWLGIPTVRDRIILQAIAQILIPIWEPAFSPFSFAYRPGQGARDALLAARRQLNRGASWIVHLDIQKFFDSVDHERLLNRLRSRIHDERVLQLIRAFLKVGAIQEGCRQDTPIGLAQGSPLSPVLANIVLDELDHELRLRDVPFVRYADDCIAFVQSEIAGRQLLQAINNFLNRRLGLRLHPTKSRVLAPSAATFVGYAFHLNSAKGWRLLPSDESLHEFKRKIESLTEFRPGRNAATMLPALKQFVRSWSGYYGFYGFRNAPQSLHGFLRQRVRTFFWNEWQTPRRRYCELIRRGVPPELARQVIAGRDAPANNPALALAFPNSWFIPFGWASPKRPRPSANVSQPTQPALRDVRPSTQPHPITPTPVATSPLARFLLTVEWQPNGGLNFRAQLSGGLLQSLRDFFTGRVAQPTHHPVAQYANRLH